MAATDFFTGRYPLNVTEWPVKNTSGSAMTSGQVVKLDASNVLGATQPEVAVVLTSANNDTPFGILVENIPAGGVGRCQVLGGAVAFGDATAIAAGAQVMPSTTAGEVTLWSTGHAVLGVACSTTANAGDPVLVKIEIHGTV